MYEISDAAAEMCMREHEALFDRISEIEDDAVIDNKPGLAHQIGKLRSDMEAHCRRLVVLWYNISYDATSLTRQGLIWYMYKKDGRMPRALKNGNDWIFLGNDRLKFLDVLKFCSGKVPLADFLNSYGIKDCCSKLHFPYDIMKSKDDFWTPLPVPYESFWSGLRGENTLESSYNKYQILIENGLTQNDALKVLKRTDVPETGRQVYDKLVQFWESKSMHYLVEYMTVYCAADILPLCKAVAKMKESFLYLTKIDIFEFNTLPSLSYAWALKHMSENDPSYHTNFVVKLEKEAFEDIDSHIMGGAATILKRLVIGGLTPIRFHKYGPEAKIAQRVLYLDYNMLYGSTADLPCPVLGTYTIRRREEGFRMDKWLERGLDALCWLSFQSVCVFEETVRTIFCVNGEKTIMLENNQRARLDGWLPSGHNEKGQEIGIAFEFHGSVVHSHPAVCDPEDENPLSGIKNSDVYQKTLDRDALIEKHPLVTRLVKIFSHQWEAQLHREPVTKQWVENWKATVGPPEIEKTFTWQKYLQFICEDKMVGIVTCSIETPEDKIELMSDHPPFFVHKRLSRDDCCEVEKAYAEKHGCLRQLTRTLCNQLSVVDTVVSSDLLKYYVIELRLRCTDIKKVIQFRAQGKPLKEWMDKCVGFREEARDEGNPVQNSTAKLLLNTYFGTSIIKAEKRGRVAFATQDKINRYYSRADFVEACPAGPSFSREALYEGRMRKLQVAQLSSKQIGFWILCVSKMLLLRFVYGVLHRFLKPECFELCGSDTDSIVVAISEATDRLTAIAKPEFKEELEQNYAKYFVDKPEDSLKPFLVKIEKSGPIWIGLATKTYLLQGFDFGTKMATKGIPKKLMQNREVLSLLNFLATVFDVDEKRRKSALVKGIRADSDRWMRTYTQTKAGLRRLCPKVGYFPCGLCNFPRDLKDMPEVLERIFPFGNRSCDLTFDMALERIKQLAKEHPEWACVLNKYLFGNKI